MEQEIKSSEAARLRAHELRVTSQRRVILGVVSDPAAGHLSADEVHDRVSGELPELARATVYNTLNEFVRVGLVRRIEGFGPARYDHDVDEEHHHFRCDTCERLFDVKPAGVSSLGLSAGAFEVQRTEILFRGRCAECAADRSD